MNKITRNSELTLPKVTTGPLPASTQGLSVATRSSRRQRAVARDRADGEGRRAAVPHLRSVRPLHRCGGRDRRDARAAAPTRGLDQRARRRRAIRRPRGQARGQRQRLAEPSRSRLCRKAAALPRSGGPARHAARIRARWHHHQGDGLRRPPREPRPRRRARPCQGGAGRWRQLRRRHPARTSRPSSCAPRSPAAAPSSRPTSITASWSR